jgi:hypothetical protein
LFLILVFSVQGCLGLYGTTRGSGKLAEEGREISGVTGVELAAIGNLYIEQGEREELRIEADDNLFRYLETDVRDGVLRIATRQSVGLLPRNPIDFFLTIRDLDTIKVTGLGSVRVEDLAVPRLSCVISGAGSIELEELQADEFDVEITGLGSLHVADGEVGRQRITISGAGSYRARHLDSAEAEVHLMSVGSATLRVRESLQVNISGTGSVSYVGDPTVEQDVSGFGRVERLDG